MVVTPQLIGRGSFAVTPHATNALDDVATGGLYVEGAGDVEFVTVDGTTDTWAVAANSFIPLAITHVVSPGTTATGIHGILA